MDLDNLSTANAKLGIVVHNYPAHKPHQRGLHAVKDGQTIKSGQVISLVKNTTTEQIEWILGVDLDGAGLDTASDMIFFATQNSDDGDVKNSGVLAGLSSAGGFELSTAYFDDGKTYNVGDQLVADGITGNVVPYASGDLTGDVFTVDPGAPVDTFVIGRVVRNYAPPVDFAPEYTPNAGTPSATSPGVSGGVFKVGRRYGATDLKMLRLETIPPKPVTIPNA